ncbi:hypothetical protein GCM10025857_31620 [Alicyclobacillus contaminans]|nr:hypothetical protein GCM10025857_31620 [Alicyclobacillus contaminans]
MFHLPMRSPHVRHEDGKSDIFGPTIILEDDGGFSTLTEERVAKVTKLARENSLKVEFKDGDILDLYDISTYDYNEILCWATVNKLHIK